MKRSKSGAQKRKEAATARDAVAKLPKMTDFFKITEQSRPGTSTERDVSDSIFYLNLIFSES